MNFQRLSHIGICVTDLEQSKKFYCDVLGFQPVCKLELVPSEQMDALVELPQAHILAEFLERDGTRIELLYYKNPGYESVAHKNMNQTGISHLSFRVQDLDAAIKAIESGGGKFLPQTRFNNPKFMMQGCFVLDPNGVRIELLQAPGDPNLLPGQRPSKL